MHLDTPDGAPGSSPIVPAVRSPGSGSVVVNGNLIQGNAALAGDGGGIRLDSTNGLDMQGNGPKHKIELYNNIVANNAAGLAGGGMSLFDAVSGEALHNTFAHNDSLGTAGEAFAPGNPQVSNPQPAGIVSHAHSPGLLPLLPGGVENPAAEPYSNPHLVNNIIWRNRSFHCRPTSTFPYFGLLPENPTGDVTMWDYWDMDVLPYGIGEWPA